jgi:CheY-like chemotaxis protein
VRRETAAGHALPLVDCGHPVYNVPKVIVGSGGGPVSGKRLLVCDDEPAVGRLVRHVAEPLGYAVETTESGEALIQAFDRFKPTLVLLDMVMPGLDGNEVIGWLAGRGTPVRLMVMSGYHSDYANHAKVLAEYKGLGPVVALNKPIDIKDLRRALMAD